jgi:transmembrane sensor
MNQNDMNPKLIQEAATWMMRLADDNASEADWEAWRLWSAQSEQHLKLRQLAQSLSGKLHNIPPAVGRAALDAPRLAGRRAAMKALALLLTAVPVGWVALQLPWQDWNADYRTNTGARRNVTLPDGTQLTLDSGSAVNVSFDAKRRMVELVSGRIFIATAADAAAPPRPFMVRTQRGMVRAIGTRFAVRRNAQANSVAVLQGAVEITPADRGAQPLILQAGQRTDFTQASVGPPSAVDHAETLWLSGRIQVNNVPLEELIRELARYRTGVLRCDPAVAGMRVSGIYRLDDTDLTLTLLASAFPLRINRSTPYWVVVGPR